MNKPEYQPGYVSFGDRSSDELLSRDKLLSRDTRAIVWQLGRIADALEKCNEMSDNEVERMKAAADRAEVVLQELKEQIRRSQEGQT